MDAEKLIARIMELQREYGNNVNVLVNHEEILVIAYREPIIREESNGHVNITSEGA